MLLWRQCINFIWSCYCGSLDWRNSVFFSVVCNLTNRRQLLSYSCVIGPKPSIAMRSKLELSWWWQDKFIVMEKMLTSHRNKTQQQKMSWELIRSSWKHKKKLFFKFSSSFSSSKKLHLAGMLMTWSCQWALALLSVEKCYFKDDNIQGHEPRATLVAHLAKMNFKCQCSEGNIFQGF